MRARSVIPPQHSTARVNVTPMIDVVMVLIVFYLLVGQLALERRASIVLPRTATGVVESARTDPIVIGIDREGACTLNGEPVGIERVENRVAGMIARDAGTPVRLRADRDAPYGVVRPVLERLRGLGLGKVELVTEQRP